uniref:BSD domain-containing protein n=1 Tax=Aegilops tauschii subsp. strangulata TaxID=200361 RepID=A0A453D4V8_AEGTS
QVLRPPAPPRGASAEAAGELSDWQQRHAVLVLARAKELAKVRYDLCPRHMKDKQFWTIYFLLARTYILPYELRAIQKEKVRRMETDNGKSKDVIAVEVEMQESKCSRESQTLPDDSEPEGS